MKTNTHNREYFFKYMSASTASIVLETNSLRWKAPSHFNDPFDHQVLFSFPFDGETLSEAITKEVARLVFDEPTIELYDSSLKSIIEILRKSSEKFDKENFIENTRGTAEEAVIQFSNFQNNYNSLISGMLNDSRVLCVSEKNDNLVMWSHYADEHKGVCLRLNCIKEIDNVLNAARKVTYQDEFPFFPTLDEYVKNLTGEHPIDFSELLYEIPYVKHMGWEYEDEWRVHIPHEPTHSNVGYDDWKENEKVFGALYLGCRIEASEAVRLVGMAELKYSEIEIYQAVRSKKRFSLEFNKIK